MQDRHIVAGRATGPAPRTAAAGEGARTEANMITDSEFIATADRTLAAIGAALDGAQDASDVDFDWSLIDGILEVQCEDGSKLIVNRHVPNREIWVAARAGGFHFRAEGGAWRDTRSGNELGATLGRLLREQAGLAVTLPPLQAPPA
jgi:CyaY protein